MVEIIMHSDFYTNYSETKFIDKIKHNLDLCESFYFSVSFIKKPGLRLVAPNIESALARGACGWVITSTYQNFTDVDSLLKKLGLEVAEPKIFFPGMVGGSLELGIEGRSQEGPHATWRFCSLSTVWRVPVSLLPYLLPIGSISR